MMDDIRDHLCWIAFIESPAEPDKIRVRVRSRFMISEPLSRKYGGGGHDNASGATVRGRAMVAEVLRDADEMVKTYKETHEGWL